jgi:ribosomal protein L37AE/L43A
MGELAVAVYEGTQYDAVMERTNPRPVRIILKVGDTRKCEGCGKRTFCLYIEGDWLCRRCAVEVITDGVFK